MDKILLALSATSSGVCIILSASVVGAPVGIASAIVTLIFPLTTGIIKKLLSITRNKKKKHGKIFMLAKSKLDSIDTLISQALIDIEISHEQFNAIIREKQKYQRMKENLRKLVKIKKIWDWIVWLQKNNEFVTNDFNWLKGVWAYNKRLSEKQSKSVKPLHHQKNFCAYIYKMDSFASFTANTWRNNGAEVIEYGGEIWISQGHLQEKLNLSNISDRTQYYSDKF